MVLKVCDQHRIKKSVFWQGINSLFKADFPANLGDSATIYQRIAVMTDLTIPEHIASDAASFVLAAWLEGEAIKASCVSDAMVLQLADHLGKLHQQTQSKWGAFHQANLMSQDWSKQLIDTIELLAKNHHRGLDKAILTQALQQAKAVTAAEFVPIMLDLRWDQFLQCNNQLSALVDLDAFVIGPRELEFVLLEYILSERQAGLFKQQYQQYQAIPDLRRVRSCYRLLLFLMFVLGEPSLTEWLKVPAKL